jgi:tetratricopeptide (TPR) repeat protein
MIGLPRILALGLIAFAAISPAAAQIENPEQSGRASMAEDDYEQAVLYFSLAIDEDNEQPTRNDTQKSDLYFLRGSSFFMLQKNEAAVEDFTHALDLKSKNDKDPQSRTARAQILNLRSQSLLEMEKFGSALKDIDLAIELAPHISAYRRQRAINLYGMDKLDEALADLNIAIGTVSKDSFLYAFRGHVPDRMGRADLAKKDFEVASKMDKEGADLVRKFSQGNAKGGK